MTDRSPTHPREAPSAGAPPPRAVHPVTLEVVRNALYAIAE